MSKTCPLCPVSERPGFDVETDDGMANVLEHYLVNHPESNRIRSIVDNSYIKRNCNDCGASYWTDCHVNGDIRGEILSSAYCPECESKNSFRELVVATVSPSVYVDYQRKQTGEEE